MAGFQDFGQMGMNPEMIHLALNSPDLAAAELARKGTPPNLSALQGATGVAQQLGEFGKAINPMQAQAPQMMAPGNPGAPPGGGHIDTTAVLQFLANLHNQQQKKGAGAFGQALAGG